MRFLIRARGVAVAVLFGALVLAACSDGEAVVEDRTTLSVYTSVTQDTVDAVVAAFEAANPDVEVSVFRAPTGELTARVAAEQREGGIGADVFWLTDPGSIQQYANDGLLRTWTPADVDAVPPQFRTDNFFGTRILNLVIVASKDLPELPVDWRDLPMVDGVVAIPDPRFAGSAFGALAFFAFDPDHGMTFYRELRDNGAVQVRSPGDVVSGVAEGLYSAGISLDRTVDDAIADGSPVELVWPRSGAIAIYSPIGVLDGSEASASEPFVDFALSLDGQQIIADTGWQPIREDVEWPDRGDQRSVDWSAVFPRQDELLAEYGAIFGG